MASIGSLVAELSANTASFQKDMGKAAQILNSHAAGMNRTVAGIERSINKVGTAFLAVFSVGAVARYGKGILDLADEYAKLSQKTGVSVEKLSEFAHGAQLSGVDINALGDSLKKLAVNMGDAATNSTGQLAATFRALGIAVTDANGNLRDTGTVFEELSALFAGAEDGPEKVAIAVKLLGKSGGDLIPLMNGLSDTSEEARRLGLVMTTEFAKASERFNDELTRMNASLKAFISNSEHGASFIDSMITALKGGQFVLMGFAQGFQELGTALGGYAAAAAAAVKLNFGEARTILKELDADLKTIQKNGEAARAALFDVAEAVNKTDTKKFKLPVIENVGQVKQYLALLQELEKATEQAQLAITTDEAAAAYQRMAITRDEFIFKAKQLGLWVEEGKKATAQQIEIQKAFQKWLIAAEKEAAFKARTPLQRLTDEWADRTKQMQDATARWAQASADALTDFVTTGKADFKSLADSIIRDLVRIIIQQKILGSFGNAGIGGTGLFGLIGGIFGFAEGGNPPIGRPSIVGENGPELIVPRTATTVIPNKALGGSVYNIDARGADRAGLARLEAMIRRLDGSIEHRSVSAWVNDRARGGITAKFG